MLKNWLTVVFAAMLILTPVTASAKGFGSHFGSRSSYSSSFSGSRGFGTAGSYRGGGLFGSSGSRYSTGSRLFSGSFGGSHLASFGFGMLLGGMFHPFGGYYGYGSLYGYHPFGGLHVILDLLVLFIAYRFLRGLFRR